MRGSVWVERDVGLWNVDGRVIKLTARVQTLTPPE